MERKLCYKARIDDIQPIPDADKIEVAQVIGWRVVVQKGQFKVGDVALYFEIDAALNPYDTRFAFLKERCYKKFMNGHQLWDECLRIKTLKLRGVISQGLLMPVSEFCEVRNIPLGEDCSAALAVRHYDEVAAKVLQTTNNRMSDAKGLFPTKLCPKTDQVRVQQLEQETLNSFADNDFEVTEKKDGSSATFIYALHSRPDDPFAVCSRNFELKDTPSAWWDMAHALDMENKLKAYVEKHGHDIAVQGEIVGPGMNGNHDMLSERDFQVFYIWDVEEQLYFLPPECQEACKEMGLRHVPVLGVYKLSQFDCNRDKMLEFAEGTTENGNEREGLVWKAMDGPFSFKTVSNRYLLKLKD